VFNKAKKAERRELQRLAEQEERERQAEEARLRAERIARLTVEREADIARYEAEEFARLRLLVENGTTTYVHAERHLPVDARMNVLGSAGGLTSLLDEINRHGLQGWEVVSVVPRTYGGFSSHKSAKSHAPGTLNTGADAQEVHLGGHVVGVYVLLKYAINAQNFVASEALVRATITELLPERLRAPIV
jgi:hypothetical protein